MPNKQILASYAHSDLTDSRSPVVLLMFENNLSLKPQDFGWKCHQNMLIIIYLNIMHLFPVPQHFIMHFSIERLNFEHAYVHL